MRARRYAPRPDGQRLDVAALTELGRALFFEPSLSASGRTACATCHDPRYAYGPPNGWSVQLAGRDGRTPGLRAAPSLRYLNTLPAFSEHHFDNDGNDSIDAGPTGGHTWDGRAGSAREQARLPLLSSAEMANATPAEVVQRLRRSALASRFRAVFGDNGVRQRRGGVPVAAVCARSVPAVAARLLSFQQPLRRGAARPRPAE